MARKNITISIDEETHRRARIRAAELDTSVSALVRDYLRDLTRYVEREPETESEKARRRQRLEAVIEDIRKNNPNFNAAENLPRDELYDRHAAR